MMKYLPLVWAALWRNRTESLLTVIALGVAFTLFATMIALNAAYERSIEDARMDRLFVVRRFEGGAIPVAYREQLLRVPGVTAVGGQLWLGGHEQDERHQILVMMVDEGMRTAWPELPMREADWRAFDADPTGIFLTRKAAARRTVKKGDRVTLNTAPGSRADGGRTWYFTVLGIIPDPPGWGQWNPDLIVGNLRYFEEAGRLDERSTLNILRLAIDRPENARAVCREIEARFTNASPALYCVPARDDARELAEASKIMYAAVRARTREIGTLRAIGFGAGPVAFSVLFEAALLGALGALIGTAIAWLIFDGREMWVWGSFRLRVSLHLLSLGLAWALVTSLAGGLLPALHAARLPASEALRAA